jgi:hypothetical protein
MILVWIERFIAKSLIVSTKQRWLLMAFFTRSVVLFYQFCTLIMYRIFSIESLRLCDVSFDHRDFAMLLCVPSRFYNFQLRGFEMLVI